MEQKNYFVPAAFTPAQVSYPVMPSTAQLQCDALTPASSKPLVCSQGMTSNGGCYAVMAVRWAAAEAAPGINIPSMVQLHAVIESTGLVDTSSPAVPTQLTTIRWVLSCTMVVATPALVPVAVADFSRTRMVAHMLGVESSGVSTTDFWAGVVVKPVSGRHSLGRRSGLDASLASSPFSDVLSLTIARRLSTSRSALLCCALHVCALASGCAANYTWESLHAYADAKLLAHACASMTAQSCPV